MKTLKLQKDSKKKYNIINTETNQVVAGHITQKFEALKKMKEYVAKPEKEWKIGNPLSRKDQIATNRAEKMDLSFDEYVKKFR